MAENYIIYVKDPKSGEVRKISFNNDKQKEQVQPTEAKKHKMPKTKKCEPRKIMGKDVGELLNEIVDPDTIDVEKLKVKDHLCPHVWESDEHMRPEVRKALLKNALEFIKFSNLEDAKFNDIILTGSLANYNWHEGSDLDVHILMDLGQVSTDKDLAYDYFKTKKSLWGDRLPIKVAGHDVELYVQDINEPHASTGVYSLLDDKWLTKPIKQMVALDIPNIQAKASDFMDAIDDLQSNASMLSSVDEIDKLQDKLKAYRKAGLDEEGEFSTENLVFKILRNTGYLEKLADLKNEVLTKELTLENVSMYTGGTLKGNIMEAGMREKIINATKKGTVALGVVVALLAGGLSVQDIERNFNIPEELIQKAEEFINANLYTDFGLEKIER